MKEVIRLLRYVLPYKSRLFSAAVCTGIVSGLIGLSMWLIKPVIDGVFVSGDIKVLYTIIWVVPLIWFVRGAALYGQVYLMQYIAQNVVVTLRNELFEKLLDLSHDFYHRHPSGRILSKITNDLSIIQNALLRVPLDLIGDSLTVVVLIGVLFYLNFRFAIIAFIVFPIVVWPLVYFARRMRHAAHKGQRQMSEIYNRLSEAIAGISVIKSFLRESEEKKRFAAENSLFYQHQMKFVKVDARSSPTMEFIGSIAITFIIWYGAMDVISGVWSTGAFFAFLGAAMSTYKPLKKFSNTNSLLQQMVVSAGRIFEILDERPLICDEPNAQKLTSFEKEIKFDDVHFYYNDAHPVVRGINFTLRKGEKLAFIGRSGSGKTTIAHLLLRFYDIQKGKILLDEIDIKSIAIASLRNMFSLVTQDIVLFNESIKFNIAYGKPNASEDDIIAAAQKANADQFIDKLPNKYNTVVGERGAKLSGGQKQRIAIARAILKNAPLLILDEATSSLDSESEKLVAEALDNLMVDKTVFMIAHRLSTIKNADRICVIENGRIVEEGNHQELIEHKGIYHRLCQLQLL